MSLEEAIIFQRTMMANSNINKSAILKTKKIIKSKIDEIKATLNKSEKKLLKEYEDKLYYEMLGEGGNDVYSEDELFIINTQILAKMAETYSSELPYIQMAQLQIMLSKVSLGDLTYPHTVAVVCNFK
jgi:hypothetical protein